MEVAPHTLAVIALTITACAHPAPHAYTDALAAVRALGADVDAHVVLEPYTSEHASTQRIGRTLVVRLPRGRLATTEAGYGYAAAVGVVAHELAHLPGVRAPFEPPPGDAESYADAVAGCALARLGLAVDGYESLVRTITAGRADAARNGWTICRERWPQ